MFFVSLDTIWLLKSLIFLAFFYLFFFFLWMNYISLSRNLSFVFQNIFVKGAKEVHIVNNTFDNLNEFSIDLRNVKSTAVEGNHFHFVMKTPFMVYDFEKYATTPTCSRADLAYSSINSTFKHNVSFKIDEN